MTRARQCGSYAAEHARGRNRFWENGKSKQISEMRECDQIENRHESQHQQISRDAPRARERKAIISTVQARQEEKRPAVLYRRIGSTNYKVTIHFDDAGGETMTDKILHMVKNEGLDFEPGRGMMDVPQMSRQPEGSTQ